APRPAAGGAWLDDPPTSPGSVGGLFTPFFARGSGPERGIRLQVVVGGWPGALRADRAAVPDARARAVSAKRPRPCPSSETRSGRVTRSQRVLRDGQGLAGLDGREVGVIAGDGHVQGVDDVHGRLAVAEDRVHEVVHEVAVRAAVAAGRDAGGQGVLL